MKITTHSSVHTSGILAMNKIAQKISIAFAVIAFFGVNSQLIGAELKDTQAVSIEVSVLHIDREARQMLVVELMGPWDDEPLETTGWFYRTFSVSKKAAAFEYVREGDRIKIDVLTSLDVKLREPTDEELATPYLDHKVTTKKGILEHVITGVCEIISLDNMAETVIFKGPRGNLLKVKVGKRSMETMNPGDTVVISYTQGEVVGITRSD